MDNLIKKIEEASKSCNFTTQINTDLIIKLQYGNNLKNQKDCMLLSIIAVFLKVLYGKIPDNLENYMEKNIYQNYSKSGKFLGSYILFKINHKYKNINERTFCSLFANFVCACNKVLSHGNIINTLIMLDTLNIIYINYLNNTVYSVNDIQSMLTKGTIYKDYGTYFDLYIPSNLEQISRKLMINEIEMLKDLLYVSEENSDFKDCIIKAQDDDINYKEFILNNI